jgi:predicted permease
MYHLLYRDGGAALAVVAGCWWETAAIRRRVGNPAAHVLRMIAWLMVAVSLFVIGSQISKGSNFVPDGWILVLEFVPLIGGFVLLVVSLRAAGYTKREQDALAARGRHARRDDLTE